MKIIMHTAPVAPLPVHDRDGKLIGFRVLEQQRIVFEADKQERALIKPGMVLQVLEGASPGELEFIVLRGGD